MGLDPSEPEQFHLLVTREAWGARAPKRLPSLAHPLHRIRYTHTDTEECRTARDCERAVRNLQREHMHKGFSDVKFNFMVGGDGRVYEGRGWYLQGELPEQSKLEHQQKIDMRLINKLAQSAEEDEKEKRPSIDIGFIGNFLESGKPIHPEMKDVAQGLVEWGIRRKILTVPMDVEEYYDPKYDDI